MPFASSAPRWWFDLSYAGGRYSDRYAVLRRRNPSPQAEDSTRPGDNLYTVALVALESKTGKLVWHFQPHDRWGYDVASPPTLFEATVDGKSFPAVGQASKLGWYYVHDRRSGALLFKSDAFVPQSNLFAPPTAEGVRITPVPAGGSNSTSLDAERSLSSAFRAPTHRRNTMQINSQMRLLPSFSPDVGVRSALPKNFGYLAS